MKKTLILRLSSIGDVVLTTPFLRVLKKSFPNIEIDFATRTEFADLLRYHPHISSLYEIDITKGRDELLRWKDFFSTQQYETIFDLHNNFRTKFLRSGMNVLIHVVNKNTFERWLLVRTKLNLFRNAVPVPEKYIRTAASLGVPADRDGPEIFFPHEISTRVQERIRNEFRDHSRPVISICPGSKHFTKRWLPEYFAILTERILKETDANVLLLGGVDDRNIAEIICRDGNSRVFNACGIFSLLETAVAFDSSRVAITNDSGLMHIASARKCPVIAIFGSTVKEFGFFPYNSSAKIFEVDNLSCRPCSHIGRDSCPKEHFKCMKKILPDVVFETVKDFGLNSSSPRREPSE